MKLLPFCVLCLLWSAPAFADTFAMIVGNNRSLSSARSDLSFADDDAMQWKLFFDSEIGKEKTLVFTRKDSDTARLFSGETKGLPTWNSLLAHAKELGSIPKGGETRELYSTFSGHGDVRKGQGYLELEDGQLTRERLKIIFAKAKADRVHVVLDACHSFFLLRPRGDSQSIVTIEQEAFVSDEIHPNMGVLISTNSEEVAYEWTPLGAGVFSHLARSGVYGAADSDLDGALRYEEVAGFISTASKTIANPLYRPQVFAKAPRDKSPFLRRAGRAGVLIDVPEQLSLRDALGVRLMDIHVEEGFSPMLFLPSREGLAVYFEESKSRRSLADVNVLSTSPVIANQLSPRGASHPTRKSLAQIVDGFRYGEGRT